MGVVFFLTCFVSADLSLENPFFSRFWWGEKSHDGRNKTSHQSPRDDGTEESAESEISRWAKMKLSRLRASQDQSQLICLFHLAAKKYSQMGWFISKMQMTNSRLRSGNACKQCSQQNESVFKSMQKQCYRCINYWLAVEKQTMSL